jgi:hypothetical protein
VLTIKGRSASLTGLVVVLALVVGAVVVASVVLVVELVVGLVAGLVGVGVTVVDGAQAIATSSSSTPGFT